MVFLVLVTGGCSNSTLPWIENDIAYDISIISSENEKLFSDGIYEPRKVLITVNLTEKQSAEIAKLVYIDWINLRSDSDTDFAANILLYAQFEKDATSFLTIENRTQWIDENLG